MLCDCLLCTHSFLVLAQLTGEAAKTALLAWAASSLREQERRFIKLKQAFSDAELDTSVLRSYTLSDRLAGVHSMAAATQRGLQSGLLFFLRGPTGMPHRYAYEKQAMKLWRNTAIHILVEKGACAGDIAFCAPSYLRFRLRCSSQHEARRGDARRARCGAGALADEGCAPLCAGDEG